MEHVRATILCPRRPSIQGPGLEHVLRRCLERIGLAIEEVSPPTGTSFAYRTGALMVAISARSDSLPEADFETALQSPLSRPHERALRREIARHGAYIRIAVNRLRPRGGLLDQAGAHGGQKLALSQWQQMLRLLHAVTSCLLQRHEASLVHWQQSDQLIAAERYRELSEEEIPWPLVARAEFRAGGQELRLRGARELIGRQIRVSAPSGRPEEMHAAALALLRQIARCGYLPEGGERLSLAGGPRFALIPPAPGDDLLLLRPEGGLDGQENGPDGHEAPALAAGSPRAARGGLHARTGAAGESAGPSGADAAVAGAGRAGGARAGAGREDAGAAAGRQDDAAPTGVAMAKTVAAMMARAELGDPFRAGGAHRPTEQMRRERTRSLALSYLMLVIMPPVGALLMLSNAIFSASTWRTSLAATAALAMAMLLGGYTFLSVAAESGLRISSQAPAHAQAMSRQAIN